MPTIRRPPLAACQHGFRDESPVGRPKLRAQVYTVFRRKRLCPNSRRLLAHHRVPGIPHGLCSHRHCGHSTSSAQHGRQWHQRSRARTPGIITTTISLRRAQLNCNEMSQERGAPSTTALGSSMDIPVPLQPWRVRSLSLETILRSRPSRPMCRGVAVSRFRPAACKSHPQLLRAHRLKGQTLHYCLQQTLNRAMIYMPALSSVERALAVGQSETIY